MDLVVEQWWSQSWASPAHASEQSPSARGCLLCSLGGGVLGSCLHQSLRGLSVVGRPLFWAPSPRWTWAELTRFVSWTL